MVDIEEIPVETILEEQPELTEPASEEIVQAVAKKRGRPPGSKNKAKKNATPSQEEVQETPRPAAKKRAASSAAVAKPKQKKQRPPSPESSSSEEEPPPKKKRRARAEPEQVVAPAPDNRQIAAEVLAMLSSRHLDMREAKRAKYRSWFQ